MESSTTTIDLITGSPAPVTLSTLCVDMKLEVIHHLNLESLINIRKVSKDWLELVQLSVTRNQLFRPRAALLKFYDRMARSAAYRDFRKTTTVTGADRNHWFGREAYIKDFVTYDNLITHIPEEFEMYILEWPEHALSGWPWPGCLDPEFERPWNREARELLSEAHHRPTVGVLHLPDNDTAATMTQQDLRNAGYGTITDSFCLHCSEFAGEDIARRIKISVRNVYLDSRGITWLVFNGAGPLNGSVWLDKRDTACSANISTKLMWNKKQGLIAFSWIDFLHLELEYAEEQFSTRLHSAGSRVRTEDE